MVRNMVRPYEDEMLASWFCRLSEANGIDDVRLFLKTFVCPQKKETNVKLSYSCTNQYLLYFCEQQKISPYDLFVNHTEYPAIAPFLSAYRQIQIMLSAFGKPMGGSVNSFIKGVRVCPECQKALPYVHVSHNLPGVRACWKHGCSLDEKTVDENDIAYARYSHDFLKANIDCNVKQMIRFAGERGIRLGQHIGFEKGIRQLMSGVSVDEIKSFMTTAEGVASEPDYMVVKGSGTITEFLHSCGTRFCMSINGFNLGFQCPKCQNKLTEDARFRNYLEHVGGYEMLTPYQSIGARIKLKHKCGRVMEIQPYHFMEGNRCICNYYHTDKEIQEKLREFGDYKLISYKKEKVTILHEKCGGHFTIGYKKFLQRPWCKLCRPRFLRSEELLSQEIKEIDPEFEYVGGYQRSASSFTIRHKCGYEFQREIYEFQNNHTCPKCTRQSLGVRRSAFFAYMSQKPDHPVSIKEMQEFSGLTYDNTKVTLQRMEKLGIVERVGRGMFMLKG